MNMSSKKQKFVIISGKKKFDAGNTQCRKEDIADANLKLPHNLSADGSNDRTQYVERLYSQHSESLLRYLRSLLPSDEEAVDILQETYIRLLKQESLDRLEANSRAYLYTIATNLVRDCLRKRTAQHHDKHVPFDEVDFSDTSSSPGDITAWQKSLDSLKQALLGLPPLTRRVFILRRFEQMTYPEIAKALNVSTRTVERHIHKAIKEMQLRLGDIL